MVTKPTVGGDVGTWGQINNDALDDLQGQIEAVGDLAAHEADTSVHGITDTALLATDDDVAAAASAAAADLNDHLVNQTDVHGIVDTSQIATLTDLDRYSAVFAGATPFDPAETVTTGDVRVYHGGMWEALQDLPANTPPLGAGDGSVGDRLLLLTSREGFASDVTGGFDYPTLTVTNENDDGAGSLRQLIEDAKAVDGGWIVFDPTFNSGVFDILLESDVAIGGTGAHNITIDGRAATVTVRGNGSPGPSADGNGGVTAPGTGVPGYSFNVSPRTYADLIAGGNTEPTNNIIITHVGFISNFGGEYGDNADKRVMNILWWSRNIWLDHLSMTNPDYPPDSTGFAGTEKSTDELLDIGYGATNVTVSWCNFYEHYKAVLVNGHSVPAPPLPPGVTVGAPGPYTIVKDSSLTIDVVRSDVTFHHCWMEHLASRGPATRGPASLVHVYNDWNEEWGAHKTTVDPIYVDDFLQPRVGNLLTGANTPNTGAAVQIYGKAQGVIENTVFTAFPGATGPAKDKGINGTDGSVKGFFREAGNVYENDSGSDAEFGTPFDPSAFYSYELDTTSGLKERLTIAAGYNTGLWAYLGAAPVIATVDVQQDGVDLGIGATLSPAATINFAGTGLDVDYDPTERAATVTVEAGSADPTLFLRSGNNLPTPDGDQDGHYFFKIVGEQLYQCRFVTGPNTWQWLPRAAAVVPAVIPGQELVHIVYRPTAQQTSAATTSATMLDIDAAAVTAAWTGIAAGAFDCTFTVPPSEAVLVRLSALMSVTAAQVLSVGLYDVDGAANITDSAAQLSNSASLLRLTYEKRLGATELTAIGTSFTVRPRWSVATGTANIAVGGAKGPFRIQVFASL